MSREARRAEGISYAQMCRRVDTDCNKEQQFRINSIRIVDEIFLIKTKGE